MAGSFHSPPCGETRIDYDRRAAQTPRPRTGDPDEAVSGLVEIGDSNPRPRRCERRALPTELYPRESPWNRREASLQARFSGYSARSLSVNSGRPLDSGLGLHRCRVILIGLPLAPNSRAPMSATPRRPTRLADRRRSAAPPRRPTAPPRAALDQQILLPRSRHHIHIVRAGVSTSRIVPTTPPSPSTTAQPSI